MRSFSTPSVLVFGVLAVLLPSCVTTQSTSSTESRSARPSRTVERGEEDPAETLRNGMTKSQVLAAYGEPSSKQRTPGQEIWIYGNQAWKRIIPYAGPFLNVQVTKVVFGSNGRVVNYRVTDKGNIRSEMEGYGTGFHGF